MKWSVLRSLGLSLFVLQCSTAPPTETEKALVSTWRSGEKSLTFTIAGHFLIDGEGEECYKVHTGASGDTIKIRGGAFSGILSIPYHLSHDRSTMTLYVDDEDGRRYVRYKRDLPPGPEKNLIGTWREPWGPGPQPTRITFEADGDYLEDGEHRGTYTVSADIITIAILSLELGRGTISVSFEVSSDSRKLWIHDVDFVDYQHLSVSFLRKHALGLGEYDKMNAGPVQP